ncbi:hypothetical protein DSO57_1022553 [Entomophthora muscae]|uniref:Uncharacterized protein n=1 Tax=Entomophthora muscae TaxID=34485 RepID=A0ACC2SG30_9FUNG|nr:hypothetical protein DSO57_1022553 [Entomophthora muscae]
MVLTTGAASPLITLFPREFSGLSPFVTEVPEPPKVSSPPLEDDITDSLNSPMVMVLLPRPVWDPFLLSLSITSKLVLLSSPFSILALWQCTLFLASVLGMLLKTCTPSYWTLVSPCSNGVHGNYWRTGQPIYPACFSSSLVGVSVIVHILKVHIFGGLQAGLMLAKQKFGCLL